MRGWVVTALALVCAASLARADDGDAPPPTGHKDQFGLSVRFGGGGRGIAPYNHNYCGQTDSNGSASAVCTGGTPLALDVEASYGVAAHVELALSLTFGLQRDFGAAPNAEGPFLLRLAAGPRIFFNETGHTQFFVQPMLLGDFTNYKNVNGQSLGDDIGVRWLEGFWIDLHRAYGFYIYVGETAEFARWLDGEIEAGIGFQGRYP
jgi:hypothetical protein